MSSRQLQAECLLQSQLERRDHSTRTRAQGVKPAGQFPLTLFSSSTSSLYRLRHKKCDETHPACLRCTSAGRECDGYEQSIDRRTREWRDAKAQESAFANKHQDVAIQIRYRPIVRPSFTAVPLSLPSTSQIELNWDARWHLDFYKNRTSAGFARHFRNSYWHALILQMCEQHPAVRHAAVAMGAWHAQFERSSRGETDSSDYNLGLRHSIKAIACLQESLAREIPNPRGSNRTHKQVVLVTCLFFTLLALFQGEFYSARCHLISGFQLLQDWDAQADISATGLALRQSFAQMHVHWFFCTHSELFLKHPELHNSEAWISAHTIEALSTFAPRHYSGVDQMNRIQEFSSLVSGFILNCTADGFDIGPASVISHEAEVVSAKVRLCRSLLTAVLVELKGLAPGDCDSLRVLSLWIEVIQIKIDCARNPKPDEMAYDDHLEQFRRVMKTGQALVDSADGPSDINFSPFNYRYGVFPALLWTAAKCRDWHTRRDTLFILQKRAADDSWASAASVAVERLIEVESNGFNPGEIIPEYARACLVNVQIECARSQVELWYRRSESASERKHSGGQWQRNILKY